MKPNLYIISNNDVVGFVFSKDNNKTILMRNSNLDLTFGYRIMDAMGTVIEDPEVEEILKDFVFRK